MKLQNNNIEELFKDKLHNLEADPGANAWAKVQSEISSGAASSSVTGGANSWVSSAIVGVVITAVVVGSYFIFNNEGEKKIQPKHETTENPRINSDFKEGSKQEEQLLDNLNETNTSTNNETKDVKETSAPLQAVSDDPKKPNFSTVLTKEVQVDKATQIINKKTIDEILAEYQQFIEEQTAARKNSTSTNNTVNSKTTEPSNNVRASDAEVPNSSTIDNEVKIGVIEEQKRIASQVSFPNAFSANFDGTNDEFQLIVEQSITIDNLQVNILNSSGTIVGVFNGIYNGWNGKLKNGSFAPEGVYIYQAIIYLDGKQIPKQGSFTLTR